MRNVAEIVREGLVAYSLVGIVALTLSITVRDIKWWHSTKRLGARAHGDRDTIPIDALETFYTEGGPEIQASTVRLIKKLYVSHPEAIGLVRQNLGNPNPTVRREAIMILSGLILDETIEYRENVCDNRTMEYLMYGLFESIDSIERGSSEEIVYRKVVLKFINHLHSTSEPDDRFMLACIQHGLIDFFINYEQVARHDPRLVTLDKLTDQMSPYFVSCYLRVLVVALVNNERCKLNLVPWHELNGEVWRRVRLLALGSCNLGALTCTHTEHS